AAPETLLRGGLHAPELLKLVLVEEDAVRVELAQQARDRATVEDLFGIDRVGRIGACRRECADERPHLLLQIILGRKSSGGKEKGCSNANHQSGQIWAISTWTCGKCLGFRMSPLAKRPVRTSWPFS